MSRPIARARKQMTEALEGRRLFAAPEPDVFGYTATSSDTIESELLVGGNDGVVVVDFSSEDPFADEFDDAVAEITFPNQSSFRFYDKSYSSLIVSTNGLITFNFEHSSPHNTDLGLGTFEWPGIAPLWNDWYQSGSGVLYRFNSDELTVQWNVTHLNQGDLLITFQAVLDLNTNGANGDIVFNYFDLDTGSPLSADGVGATVGIKEESRTQTDPEAPPARASRLLVSWDEANDFVKSGKSIRITPPLDRPVASDDSATVAQGDTVVIDVLANDTGGVNAEVFTDPSHGSVQLWEGGTLLYIPDPEFAGTDTFTYVALDASGKASAPAVVTVTVGDVNDPPVAADDSAATTQDTGVIGNVLGNDADADDADLTAELLSGATNGVVSLQDDGTFAYTPRTGFYGYDSFTYRVYDGRGGTDEATATITVAPAAAETIYMVDDPTVLGGTILIVNGSGGSDVIGVVGGSDGVEVFFSGVSKGVFHPTGHVVVYARGGNDEVLVGSGSAWVYGEDGNDLISLGSNGGIAFGGGGSDQLVGGTGRDILVGGEGGDLLMGGHAEDILVSALTAYDDRFARADHIEAWASVRAEWLSGRAFVERVGNIRGTGTGERLNGSFLLNESTLRDDADSDRIDVLNGGSGKDWFLYRATEDRVTLINGIEATVDTVLT